jgi:hypothetical protein
MSSERNRLEIREFRNLEAAKEQERREAEERPIKEAEEKLQKNFRKLAEVYRERLLGTVPDPDRIPVDPAVAAVVMSLDDAGKFNKNEFIKYHDSHPDVFWNDELIDNLGVYFAKNGLQIITSDMIGALIDRYREASLLPEPPQVEPEPLQTEEPVQTTQASEPELIDGFDLESGAPRKWTARELDRLSSTDYRRALHLYKDAISLAVFRR